MRPSRITMVPRSIAGPATGTMRAFVMAYVPGALRSRWTPICAAADGGVATTATTAMVADAARTERRKSILKRLLASVPLRGGGDASGTAREYTERRTGALRAETSHVARRT